MVAPPALARLVTIAGTVRRDLVACPNADARGHVLGRAYQELRDIGEWWKTTEGQVRDASACLFRQTLDLVDALGLVASACPEVVPVDEADLPAAGLRRHGQGCACGG